MPLKSRALTTNETNKQQKGRILVNLCTQLSVLFSVLCSEIVEMMTASVRGLANLGSIKSNNIALLSARGCDGAEQTDETSHYLAVLLRKIQKWQSSSQQLCPRGGPRVRSDGLWLSISQSQDSGFIKHPLGDID